MPRARKKSSSMKVKTPGSRQNVNNMKYEIANEFGVKLGASASSRENGLVGGEMTKRLVQRGLKKRSTSTRKKSK